MSTKPFANIRATLVLLGLFSVLLGGVYPVVCTLVLQVAFPHQAGGSLMRVGDKVMGSELIGQSFTSPRYFWSRPSVTDPPYNPAASQGSNFSSANPAQHEAVKQRIAALRKADPKNDHFVPVELVTASGSGLDPEISMEAAEFQVKRVAKARQMDESGVRGLGGGAPHPAPRWGVGH
jgi:K+-transporting ATPase ATPase C chain